MSMFSATSLGNAHSLQQAMNVIHQRRAQGLCVFVECTSVLRSRGINLHLAAGTLVGPLTLFPDILQMAVHKHLLSRI
jgi:hypothetical protein